MAQTIPHPPITSRELWLAERKQLLAQEKELTGHRDRINAELTDAYSLLDMTPYGRQQDFEDSPPRLAAEADLRLGPSLAQLTTQT